MIPDELSSELKSLRERGFQVDVTEQDTRVFLIFQKYALPSGVYSITESDLMVFTTTQYPNAGFDMFWVDENLKLKDGRLPRGAEAVESYLGKRWRRFSYHPYNGRQWNPAEDNLERHMEYVRQRLFRGD